MSTDDTPVAVDEAKYGFELRSEVLRTIAMADEYRRGESDTLVVGRFDPTDPDSHNAASLEYVRGEETVTVEGSAKETVGHHRSTVAHSSRLHVEGNLNVSCKGDTMLIGGAVTENYIGATALLAGMSDDMIIGGGARVTAPTDITLAGLIGQEQKIGTAISDASLTEMAPSVVEREYGPGVHVCEMVIYNGVTYNTMATSLLPMIKTMSGIRNLLPIPGGGGGGGSSSAPSGPPLPAGAPPVEGAMVAGRAAGSTQNSSQVFDAADIARRAGDVAAMSEDNLNAIEDSRQINQAELLAQAQQMSSDMGQLEAATDVRNNPIQALQSADDPDWIRHSQGTEIGGTALVSDSQGTHVEIVDSYDDPDWLRALLGETNENLIETPATTEPLQSVKVPEGFDWSGSMDELFPDEASLSMVSGMPEGSWEDMRFNIAKQWRITFEANADLMDEASVMRAQAFSLVDSAMANNESPIAALIDFRNQRLVSGSNMNDVDIACSNVMGEMARRFPAYLEAPTSNDPSEWMIYHRNSALLSGDVELASQFQDQWNHYVKTGEITDITPVGVPPPAPVPDTVPPPVPPKAANRPATVPGGIPLPGIVPDDGAGALPSRPTSLADSDVPPLPPKRKNHVPQTPPGVDNGMALSKAPTSSGSRNGLAVDDAQSINPVSRLENAGVPDGASLQYNFDDGVAYNAADVMKTEPEPLPPPPVEDVSPSQIPDEVPRDNPAPEKTYNWDLPDEVDDDLDDVYETPGNWFAGGGPKVDDDGARWDRPPPVVPDDDDVAYADLDIDWMTTEAQFKRMDDSLSNIRLTSQSQPVAGTVTAAHEQLKLDIIRTLSGGYVDFDEDFLKILEESGSLEEMRALLVHAERTQPDPDVVRVSKRLVEHIDGVMSDLPTRHADLVDLSDARFKLPQDYLGTFDLNGDSVGKNSAFADVIDSKAKAYLRALGDNSPSEADQFYLKYLDRARNDCLNGTNPLHRIDIEMANLRADILRLPDGDPSRQVRLRELTDFRSQLIDISRNQLDFVNGRITPLDVPTSLPVLESPAPARPTPPPIAPRRRVAEPPPPVPTRNQPSPPVVPDEPVPPVPRKRRNVVPDTQYQSLVSNVPEPPTDDVPPLPPKRNRSAVPKTSNPVPVPPKGDISPAVIPDNARQFFGEASHRSSDLVYSSDAAIPKGHVLIVTDPRSTRALEASSDFRRSDNITGASRYRARPGDALYRVTQGAADGTSAVDHRYAQHMFDRFIDSTDNMTGVTDDGFTRLDFRAMQDLHDSMPVQPSRSVPSPRSAPTQLDQVDSYLSSLTLLQRNQRIESIKKGRNSIRAQMLKLLQPMVSTEDFRKLQAGAGVDYLRSILVNFRDEMTDPTGAAILNRYINWVDQSIYDLVPSYVNRLEYTTGTAATRLPDEYSGRILLGKDYVSKHSYFAGEVTGLYSGLNPERLNRPLTPKEIAYVTYATRAQTEVAGGINPIYRIDLEIAYLQRYGSDPQRPVRAVGDQLTYQQRINLLKQLRQDIIHITDTQLPFVNTPGNPVSSIGNIALPPSETLPPPVPVAPPPAQPANVGPPIPPRGRRP
ncbi:MAG: hypothetical protein OXC62_12165 [Aestuariivita sp.]|nr:hypothetical protein [Aestuariivita sp.]